ncbi:hypothetical protein V492_04056, partial [Pseudogymnoascus sp. VKM F-4246]
RRLGIGRRTASTALRTRLLGRPVRSRVSTHGPDHHTPPCAAVFPRRGDRERRWTPGDGALWECDTGTESPGGPEEDDDGVEDEDVGGSEEDEGAEAVEGV